MTTPDSSRQEQSFEERPTMEQLWTPANKVTLLRLCLIPVFFIVIISPWPSWIPQWSNADTYKPFVAAIVFAIVAATDSLDGYLARSRNEVTTLGKFMDPLADKILVTAALLALIELGKLPSWVALIIIAREFIVSGIRMVAASDGIVIAASWYGKAKTVAQIVAILLFIVKDSHMVSDLGAVFSDRFYLFSWAVMIVALALTIISMLDYFSKASELLGFSSSEKSHKKSKKRENAFISKTHALDANDALSISPENLFKEAKELIQSAQKYHLSVGTAESCTGGLIAGELTAVPGSSEVVHGGVVSYVYEVKERQLGVQRSLLEEHGAVNEQTACQMAQGARERLNVDVAVSATGIAGPGGEEPGKPVGTVWLGLSDAHITYARIHHYEGNREQVRMQAVRDAIAMLQNSINTLSEASANTNK